MSFLILTNLKMIEKSKCVDDLLQSYPTRRRCPDLEGLWKVVAKEGESAFLDACGVLEPNKVLVVVF